MWLAIRFTQFALDAIDAPALSVPQAVIENNQIICVDRKASQLGIKIAQSLAAAYQLCDELQLYERKPQQEKQKIDQLATLLYVYSSQLVIESGELLLMEISRSLKLYSNLDNLLNLIKQELTAENVQFRLGIGHTPKSAVLLSSPNLPESIIASVIKSIIHSKQTSALDDQFISSQLAPLSVKLLALPEQTIEQFLSVGIRQIQALKQLPASAIIKRFGKPVYQYLLQLYGQMSDPQNYFEPAETFYQKLEFLEVIEHRNGLLFPMKRLIKSLCRFLQIKQKASQTLHWILFDSEKNTQAFEVLVSTRQNHANTYLTLTQLSLERYQLQAPIEAIVLSVDQLEAICLENNNLLDSPEAFTQNIDFIHRIRAKLGHHSCLQLTQKLEHLPELASQFSDIATLNFANGKTADMKTEFPLAAPLLSLPSWLLEPPEPITCFSDKLIWHGQLKIISHPEKLASYWWQQKAIRDYFLAEHDNGSIYWIFVDKLTRQWFVHGIYS